MQDPFDLVGETIANSIRVDSVIAEGGFGVVYKGFHTQFRSPVALKCLKVPGSISADARDSFLEQFRREAEVQFRLSAMTPHVVRPFHIGEAQLGSRAPIPVMALEWLEGTNLADYAALRACSALPPATLGDMMDLLGPAARAIHSAHSFDAVGGRMTVVHRDIKPENLFLAKIGGRQIIKVLDFGISKVKRAATLLAGERTQAARPQFSPNYGAPEQWVPKSLGQTGPWTDVWGLALTLVELLKGSTVLDGNLQALMYACLNERARPTPREHGVSVGDEVEAVFARALAVDPRARTKTVREFWLGLRGALEKDGDEPAPSFRARLGSHTHIKASQEPNDETSDPASRTTPLPLGPAEWRVDNAKRMSSVIPSHPPASAAHSATEARLSWPPSDAPAAF